ncbi:hypothetical protein TRVL_01860 [Trypanosoma vivax]|nr:hypothetical protein TRVL_01860 [Trypanosoma vivax]
MRRWAISASSHFHIFVCQATLHTTLPLSSRFSIKGKPLNTARCSEVEPAPCLLDEDGADTIDDLPPWPIDEIEFNTRAPFGGHDIRRAREREAALLAGLEKREADGAPIVNSFPELKPLSDEQRRQVRQVEETAEGVDTLKAGGWVCGSCLRCMPHPSRSVCDGCHSVRHDIAVSVLHMRQSQTVWLCGHCSEFNFEQDTSCRCCGAQNIAQETPKVQHLGVQDEVQRAPVGSVVVTRNRVMRWRCTSCSEANALQSSKCRNCSRGRFDFSVCCWQCGFNQQLNNSILYGCPPSDKNHDANPFGLHNCFPRLAPEQRCTQCSVPLHGATASSRSDAWLCACGIVCNAAAVSCGRCRLPRRFTQLATLEELLRVWDFAGATNWLCEGCNHVNKASRYIVSLNRNNSVGASMKKGTMTRFARIVHGSAKCERCGLRWHHQLVNDGQHWRCACHMVNKREEVRCQVCHLPAADGIRSDVLSFWSRGDWYCFKCQRQNYRERIMCLCGESRPRDEVADKSEAAL